MRIIFAGTPDFAAQHLEALLQHKLEVVAVYTQPDRPAGRGKKMQASAVKLLAQANQLPIEQPLTLRDTDAQTQLAKYQADLMVVVAYGLILPQAILDMPTYGCINVHGSLLPKWRGAAPIQRAIWAGDQQTGVTLMQMDAGLDTGPMLYKQPIDILADDTSASLYTKLAKIGPEALIHTIQLIQDNRLNPEAQDNSQATYAEKLDKKEALIDWQQPATFIERCIRAFTPWPGAEFYREKQRIKVIQAQVIKTQQQGIAGAILQANKDGIDVQCGEGVLRLLTLQPAGKKPLSCQDILNARRHWFVAGTVLDSSK